VPTPEYKTCNRCGQDKPLADFYKHAEGKLGRRPECKVCFLAIGKARRDANVDAARAYDRERYGRESERRKATARAYYWANREAVAEQKKGYYEANRERFAAWTATNKARRRNVERQHYTRREIYDRDGGRCRLCNIALPYGPNAFHLDHIVPIVLGGPDIPANVQLACQPCNRSKWANLEGQIYFAC
jgi:hypothetical protein